MELFPLSIFAKKIKKYDVIFLTQQLNINFLLFYSSAESPINSMIKSNCRSRYCVHELFGFDVLLDENLKPWILEVNISPRYIRCLHIKFKDKC